MDLMQLAIDKEGSIDVIERLAKLQQDAQAQEAQRLFADALHRAQMQMGRISADALNPQTKSRYVTYAKLDKVLRPIYSQEGFALSFDTEESTPEMIRVLCYVSHIAGHTRTYRINMPADGKGAKGGDVMTKTHATGAAASYGMRYLLKMIFNVAVGEDDDDGNMGARNGIGEDVQNEHLDAIRQAPDLESLKRVYKEAYKAAHTINDAPSKNLFIKVYEEQKAKFAAEGR
jgi:hypothetical protein